MKPQNVDLPWKGSETRDYKPYSTKISLMKKQRNNLLKKKEKNQTYNSYGKSKKEALSSESNQNFNVFIQELKHKQNTKSEELKTKKIFSNGKVMSSIEKNKYAYLTQLLNQSKHRSTTHVKRCVRKQKQTKLLKLQNVHHNKTEPISFSHQNFHKKQRISFNVDKKFFSPPRSHKNTLQIFLDYHNLSKNQTPLPLCKRVGVFRYKKTETLKLPIKQLKVILSDESF